MTLRPEGLPDLFSREIDEKAVQFVRPGDTDRPSWYAYDDGEPLGALSVDNRGGTPVWLVQSTSERYQDLDDAVRALRRPRTWPRERDQVAEWARRILADPDTVLVDVETTGLTEPWAVQIAVVDARERVLFNELINPRAPIEKAATAVHGITADHVQDAPRFGEILPALAGVLRGRRCLAYNAQFDQDCVERELRRRQEQDPATGVFVDALRDTLRWVDALQPYAVWRGLWSAKLGTYRSQKLDGPHDAAGDCLALLQRLHQMAETPHHP